MLESLLFIFLIFVGGITLIISLIFILIGLSKKSSKVKKIGYGIGIVSILCFGLIALYYLLILPSLHKNQMDDLAGTYQLYDSSKQIIAKKELHSQYPELILLADGTYKFDEIEGVGLQKNGTWKTGGIDGMLEFDVKQGREWASPSGDENDATLTFEYQNNQDDRENTKLIVFVKK
ncbi:hypothetical protein [Cellulophaga lytica]|uniref:Uncharacterized protein n=1 Tax=Cellulophaga lytica (strain ATCC 23178 / DSM 7489 / JCM 8516 / NBRC 14961 / NCIMB 1423 / VKM B-1433 / Cy l20) TaxID=867900 RepID=F0R9M2_CELLC|nr:hypothetical protein [Cellulophaga lytica]ADY29354.1 hypothetical protein Celly_1530 [Cellulophaga lytica DSM 7489]WQG76471.1 hypothetical protein SR888_12340 [Cellulophaga lytica]